MAWIDALLPVPFDYPYYGSDMCLHIMNESEVMYFILYQIKKYSRGHNTRSGRIWTSNNVRFLIETQSPVQYDNPF